MREPLISVVVPIYNGGPYLIDALASVVEQTFGDWEMICVNDGSSDGSGEVADWFARQDSRIRVIHQTNAGIVSALNTGWRQARGPLICRMDCDDIAQPDRLQTQQRYLRDHPECVVVGGSILEIDHQSDPLAVSRLPEQHAEIVKHLLHRRTGHFHPTTMMRTEAVRAVGGYREQYQWIEDHDLWLRLSRRGRLANLAEILLYYRQHPSSVCWQRAQLRVQLMNSLMRDAYRVRGRDVPHELILSGSVQRSAAGPGKWARAAAKGGFVRSSFKQLAHLWRGPDRTTYKLRMTCETLARLPVGVTRRAVQRDGAVSIPTFPKWHQAWHEHLAAQKPGSAHQQPKDAPCEVDSMVSREQAA